jgi:hypothetical protein
MSFENFWDKLLKSESGADLRPITEVDTRKVEITVTEFRKLLLASYNDGWKAGNNSKSLFDSIFGK